MDVDTPSGTSRSPQSAETQHPQATPTTAPETNPNPTANPKTELVEPVKLKASQIQQYIAMADKRTKMILDAWKIRVLTEEERQKCIEQTRHLVRVIRGLEAKKDEVAPLINPQLETTLFMARLEWRVTFGRVFRFHELPTEIISNIFHLVSWSASNPTLGQRARARITSVCRLWRKVALEDPTLWNVVWFKYSGCEQDLQRASVWFDRAGDSPKDVRISDGGQQQPLPVQCMERILAQVSKKWTTIRILVVLVHNWDPALMILSSLRSVAQASEPMMMRRFELHRTGSPYVQVGVGYFPDGYRQPMPVFGGLHITTLEHFSLNGIHIDWNRSHLTNLTVLDLRRIALNKGPTLQQFRAMLTSSPLLRKLILDGAGPSLAGREQDPPPIVLNNLRVLVLVDFSASYGTFLLSLFKAPYVRDLTLMNLVGEDYTPFFSAMTGEYREVRILTLYNSELRATVPSMDGPDTVDPRLINTVVRWLCLMPHITYLRIGTLRLNFFEIFLRYWNYAKGNQPPSQIPVSPRLEILEWQSMDTNVIGAWLTRRKQMGVPIKKLYIGEITASKIDQTQHEALTSALAPGGDIYLLRAGHKSPEEAAALQD
ncbi:hypothetical protein CC1G_01859 [Coprinopsis cinerea okayama7|uniref:F-box domain-containing protein n=1 Tax=Coprinopsis cinerea (strain Okayama-7 / 130 / ATCC MYA-4618 / FGSC 9003) TaxID=240176 RepID=A8N2P5_COPC7|nr:hypothetical protein CC1G_01859 [Coprinopsis cinerea okayama7\|eukprot:XP_001829179.1 hypothetical protein CC1G_01859 [Coprinopsis cinerea okayama7\